MAIVYKCKHCLQTIGSVDAQYVDEQRLGLHQLTTEEYNDIVYYNKKRKEKEIYIICDQCIQTLKQHPQYHELNHFIH